MDICASTDESGPSHTHRERRSPSPSLSQVLSRVFGEKNCEAISVRHSRERVAKEEYVDLHSEAGLQWDVRSTVTLFKREVLVSKLQMRGYIARNVKRSSKVKTFVRP